MDGGGVCDVEGASEGRLRDESSDFREGMVRLLTAWVLSVSAWEGDLVV